MNEMATPTGRVNFGKDTIMFKTRRTIIHALLEISLTDSSEIN